MESRLDHVSFLKIFSFLVEKLVIFHSVKIGYFQKIHVPQKQIQWCCAYSKSEAGYCSCRFRAFKVIFEPLWDQMIFFENSHNFGQIMDIWGENLNFYRNSCDSEKFIPMPYVLLKQSGISLVTFKSIESSCPLMVGSDEFFEKNISNFLEKICDFS